MARLDLIEHVHHHGFGVVPHFVRADALVGAGRQLDDDLVEAEVGVHRKNQLVDLVTLGGELLFGAEDMRVVLGEGAHAHDAMQRPRRLVAVDDAEFGQAQRQLAIGAQAVLEDLDVAGAVHRLDGVDALVFLLCVVAGRARHEHVFAIPAPVAGDLPQLLVEHLRCADLLVVGGEAAAHVGDQGLVDGPPLGVPEHRARPFLLEVEEVHLARQLAMVALLGFLELLDIGVELFPPGEGGAVDARQHRLGRVATPIGAGDLHQLERVADLAGRGHVRATAEVGPFALAVELDFLISRNRVDQLDLKRLALLLEEALGGVAAHRRLHERLIARDDLAHALFDRRKVFWGERRRTEEIVIEAVLDHRADRHLRIRPQRLHRLGKHMRRVVADQLERARVVAVDELDLGVGVDLFGEIGQDAVARHRDAALGQRWRNRFGDVEAGKARLEGAARAIGKGNLDHNRSYGSLADTNRRKRMGCV